MKPYRPQPIDTSHVEFSPDLLELVERLSVSIHDNWALKRLDEGWRYGPHRDDGKREHPGLVPYDDLSEVEKDYDRKTVLEALRGAVALGYEIRKQD